MLSVRLKAALSALKDIATHATNLPSKSAEDRRQGLADARQRKAQFSNESLLIIRLLMSTKDPSLTILTLDEERLTEELEKNAASGDLLGFNKLHMEGD